MTVKNLIVSSSPHIGTKTTTQSIMRDVIIALSPATVAGIVLFGWKALVTILVCVSSAVASEFLFNLAVRKKQTVTDLSAVVTGLLLALTLPTTAEIWHCIVGSVFAIVVVKCLFGGIGCNFANPAITARILLISSFSSAIATGSQTVFQTAEAGVDTVASATPLAITKVSGVVSELPSITDMLIGNRGGAIGETCIIALLLGFVYLLVRKVITWHIPVIYIGSTAVLSLLLEMTMYADADPMMVLYQSLGGGLFLGAIFMATDYVTTPINKVGKMVFALGCALLTVLIRMGGYPEGVSFAILIMNILAPYIEKGCAPKPFGKVGANSEK